jgi:hypothetical protein
MDEKSAIRAVVRRAGNAVAAGAHFVNFPRQQAFSVICSTMAR